MTYEEAVELSFNVRWKTTTCISGEECWCRIIEPETEIKFDNTATSEEIFIVPSGSISKEYAEYLVKLHNNSLNENN